MCVPQQLQQPYLGLMLIQIHFFFMLFLSSQESLEHLRIMLLIFLICNIDQHFALGTRQLVLAESKLYTDFVYLLYTTPFNLNVFRCVPLILLVDNKVISHGMYLHDKAESLPEFTSRMIEMCPAFRKGFIYQRENTSKLLLGLVGWCLICTASLSSACMSLQPFKACHDYAIIYHSLTSMLVINSHPGADS